MDVTPEQIITDLQDFFLPFVCIVLKEKIEGDFDIRNINGTHLKFIIYDKKWDDKTKKRIWEETYDVSTCSDLKDVKLKLGPLIKESIGVFCNKCD